jgi:hypothetical protein
MRVMRANRCVCLNFAGRARPEVTCDDRPGGMDGVSGGGGREVEVGGWGWGKSVRLGGLGGLGGFGGVGRLGGLSGFGWLVREPTNRQHKTHSTKHESQQHPTTKHDTQRTAHTTNNT